jgi:hypothetical protein
VVPRDGGSRGRHRLPGDGVAERGLTRQRRAGGLRTSA